MSVYSQKQFHLAGTRAQSCFLLLALLAIMCAGRASAQINEDQLPIIPKPAQVARGEGTFVLSPETRIFYGMGTLSEAEYLADVIAPAIGYELSFGELSNEAPVANAIILRLDSSLESLGEEGYRLSVSPNRIEATAYRPAGVFYATQTMRQLLPPQIFSDKKADGVEWSLPAVEIEDEPRFAWRGQLIDTGRHYFDVAMLKRAIDLIALHKLNRLHWHLTEDQGWRIEIKRYPKLTEVGSWRTHPDGTRHGGFYTQDEVRDIVAYAAERHITVVPEIEMPGHSMAALASYPNLGCTGGPYEVAGTWGIKPDVYCAGNEETLVFNKNVLDEVMELFPSQYIHIGGDECPKDRWKECPKCQHRIAAEGLKDEHELQSYFIKEIDKYLAENGRRLIGWDEILEGGLAPGAIVQSWRGIQGGITAANAGHDVIMSPTSHCYIDYSYMRTPLSKSYSYEPIPEELPADKAHHVLGLEGNTWGEHVPNRDRFDYQTYPRLTALAEVGWSPKMARDWDDFKSRLETQYERFDVLGVKYGVDELSETIHQSKVIGHWTPQQMMPEVVTLEWDVTDAINAADKYNIILLYTRGAHGIDIEHATLLENGKQMARDAHKGFSGADKRDIVYSLDLKSYDPSANYTVQVLVAPDGGTDSAGEVRISKGRQEK